MASFAELPVELHVSHIAKKCDQAALMALSSASRLLRQLYSPEAFKNVVAEQRIFGMVRMLKILEANKQYDDLVKWPQLVKQASFKLLEDVHGFPNDWITVTFLKQDSTTFPPLLQRLFDCVWSMQNLKVLRLHFEICTFDQFRDRPALTIEYLDLNSFPGVTAGFLEVCEPGTLESLKIHGPYEDAARLHPGLRKLHLTRTQCFGAPTSRLSGQFIKAITEKFTQLEWLVLDDTKCLRDKERSLMNREQVDNFIEECISAIKECHKMRCFAFSLRFSCFDDTIISDPDTEGCDFTRLYLKYVRQLITKLPQLEKACIIDDAPYIYQAVRRDGEVLSWEEEISEEDRRERFPFDPLDPSLAK